MLQFKSEMQFCMWFKLHSSMQNAMKQDISKESKKKKLFYSTVQSILLHGCDVVTGL